MKSLYQFVALWIGQANRQLSDCLQVGHLGVIDVLAECLQLVEGIVHVHEVCLQDHLHLRYLLLVALRLCPHQIFTVNKLSTVLIKSRLPLQDLAEYYLCACRVSPASNTLAQHHGRGQMAGICGICREAVLKDSIRPGRRCALATGASLPRWTRASGRRPGSRAATSAQQPHLNKPAQLACFFSTCAVPAIED